MRGLYIHIPFCKYICNYCDFYKRIKKNEEQIINYIGRISEELRHYESFLNDEIETIYIGGGTPNFLSDIQLELLLNEISKYSLSNVKEYTIEVNPELLTDTQIQIIKKYGINRVSIGVQTFNEEKLKLLNRHHHNEDVFKAIQKLREHDITNINIDLIFGLPDETISDIQENLKIIEKLKIPHVSYYSLILEEKTVFWNWYQKKMIDFPDSDTTAIFFEKIIDSFHTMHFHHYEISNFALKGFESIHNQIYWKNKEYIGIGCGASGYIHNVRYNNHSILDKYQNEFRQNEEIISSKTKAEEFMMLGLRMMDGIDLNDYYTQFHSNPIEDFNLQKHLESGLLEIRNNFIRFTKKGLFLGNIVFEEFVLKEAANEEGN